MSVVGLRRACSAPPPRQCGRARGDALISPSLRLATPEPAFVEPALIPPTFVGPAASMLVTTGLCALVFDETTKVDLSARSSPPRAPDTSAYQPD